MIMLEYGTGNNTHKVRGAVAANIPFTVFTVPTCVLIPRTLWVWELDILLA